MIWDKFMMIMMGIMTTINLAIVFFLYVAEICQNDIDFEDDDGMTEESDGQGRSQPHGSGWARFPLSSFFLKF